MTTLLVVSAIAFIAGALVVFVPAQVSSWLDRRRMVRSWDALTGRSNNSRDPFGELAEEILGRLEVIEKEDIERRIREVLERIVEDYRAEMANGREGVKP